MDELKIAERVTDTCVDTSLNSSPEPMDVENSKPVKESVLSIAGLCDLVKILSGLAQQGQADDGNQAGATGGATE